MASKPAATPHENRDTVWGVLGVAQATLNSAGDYVKGWVEVSWSLLARVASSPADPNARGLLGITWRILDGVISAATRKHAIDAVDDFWTKRPIDFVRSSLPTYPRKC